MNRLITVSRAARLAGVTRAALQKRIRGGELTTFEGMLDVADLLQVYPQTETEDNSMIERVDQIMEAAVSKVVLREVRVPDIEIMAERMALVSSELAQAKVVMNRQQSLVDDIEIKLSDLVKQYPGDENYKELQSWITSLRRERVKPHVVLERITARHAFLRIMAADVKVLPSGHEFLVEGKDSILEAALNSGCNLAYGCSDGSCGLCKTTVISGKVKRIATSICELSEQERNSGVVLMCCNTAITDLVIKADEAIIADDIPQQKITARVKAIDPAGESVSVVRLQTPVHKRLRFLAGQSVVLQTGDSPGYEMPVASCPCHETYLEFHVPLGNGFDIAASLSNALANSDPVLIEGPTSGFTLLEDSHKPIICIAWDLGFAPIKSLIEHAMALDITESMHLYRVSTGATAHYMNNLCRSWADALDEFRYTPLTVDDGRQGVGESWSPEAVHAQLQQVIADYPEFDNYNIYIAGPGRVIDAAAELFISQGVEESCLFRERLPEGCC